MKEAQRIKNLKYFGYGFAVIFTLFALMSWHKRGYTPRIGVLLALAAGFTVWTSVNLDSLEPFYKVWMKVARLIGEVISTVVLSICFYLLFGITGIIFRLLGKDLLDRKLDPARESYWHKIERKEFDPKNYLKQF